jgi:hypothetical protein
MYICYTPASFASKEDIEKKASYFKDRYGTVSQFSPRFSVHKLILGRLTGHTQTFSSKKTNTSGLESQIRTQEIDQHTSQRKAILCSS